MALIRTALFFISIGDILIVLIENTLILIYYFVIFDGFDKKDIVVYCSFCNFKALAKKWPLSTRALVSSFEPRPAQISSDWPRPAETSPH